MANEQRIKKIKLSNNQVYSIFDEGALRRDPTSKKLLSGDSVVDALIIDGNLSIVEIDDIPVTDSIDNVLVQGTDGLIQKRTTDKLLEDIGGVAYSMDSSTGVLSLKIGKF